MLDRFGPVYWGKPARTSFELECIDRLPEPLTDDPVPFRFWPNGFFLRSVGGATLEILKSYIETRAANSP